jgi:polyhydroxybutyrate depolymerase
VTFRYAVILAAACLLPLLAKAADCGGAIACGVEDGDYRIEMPQAGAPKGVLVFFHGYKGSAERQMEHSALIAVAHAHGLAFVAVDGLNGTWSHPNAPGHFRNETRFIGHVFDDLQTRFGFTALNTLVGGFSQGASMAWYTLCQQGARVAGAVTFSGVFWNPLPKPQDCVADMPPLVHFHGTADQTFPLGGRAIGERFHQGDTFKSMAIVRERAACAPAETRQAIAGVDCTVAAGCHRGEMALCLHDGGHEIRPDQLDAGLTAIGF